MRLMRTTTHPGEHTRPLRLGWMCITLLGLCFATSARADWPTAREAFWVHQPNADRLLKDVAQSPTLDDVSRRDAFHLLGRHLARTGRFEAAVDAYREAVALGVGHDAAAPSAIPDVLSFGLLSAMVESRDPNLDELLALASSIEHNPFSDVRQEASFLVARHLEAINHPDALAAYQRTKARWPEATFMPELERRLAALASPTRPVSDAPEPLDGDAALRLASLGNAPPSPSPAKRVALSTLREHLTERRFDLLDEGLEPWLVEPPEATPEQTRDYLDALELSLDNDYENFRFQDALATHNKLKKRGRRGLSAHKETRLYALDGQFDKARADLQKRHGKRSRAYHNALGDLAFEFARFDEAYSSWVKARGRGGEKNPTDKMVWALLRMGKANEAARHWEPAGKARGAGKNLYERYWLARSRQLAGRAKDATALFEGLVADAPLDYYGLQAASRLMELTNTVPEAVPTPPLNVLRKGGEPEVGRSTINWSADSLAGAFDAAPKRASHDELVAESTSFAKAWGTSLREANRAAELIALGDYDAAISELRVIDMDMRSLRLRGHSGLNRTRSELLDNRSSAKARGGESMRSDQSRRTVEGVAIMRRSASGLRKDLRRLQVMLADPYGTRRAVLEEEGHLTPELLAKRGKELYPLAYPEVVEPLARQLGVPPYFIYAVMTVESAFHPGAVSVADAYGLVQVIPRTGDNLARELGFVDFTPEHLLQPPVSVYFGGYYLARLLSRFSGQEPLAAAAYNAGPHRVTTWLLARGQIPLDMFIEDIPYDQARAYTKRIFEHVGSYRRVYHAEATYYIRNTIDTRLGEGPNY